MEPTPRFALAANYSKRFQVVGPAPIDATRHDVAALDDRV